MSMYANGEEIHNWTIDLKKSDNYFRPMIYIVGNIAESETFFFLYNLSTLSSVLTEQAPIVIHAAFEETPKRIGVSANRHNGIQTSARIQIVTPKGVGTQFILGIFGGGKITGYWKD